MKTFYLALDGDIIVDAIEYPHDGYIEVELPTTHLPAGINGGWYRWDGATYVLDEELKQAANELDELEQLKEVVADLTELVLFGGGA
jgi:hypothetical protein